MHTKLTLYDSPAGFVVPYPSTASAVYALCKSTGSSCLTRLRVHEVKVGVVWGSTVSGLPLAQGVLRTHISTPKHTPGVTDVIRGSRRFRPFVLEVMGGNAHVELMP